MIFVIKVLLYHSFCILKMTDARNIFELRLQKHEFLSKFSKLRSKSPLKIVRIRKNNLCGENVFSATYKS